MTKRKIGKQTSGKPREAKAVENNEEGWSKSKKRRMRKIQRRANDVGDTAITAATQQHGKSKRSSMEHKPKQEPISAENITTEAIPSKPLDLGTSNIRPKSELQQAFLSRLAGSRFRELNEDLYTSNSSSAFERFQNNPELFDQYHEGFRTQVKAWPVNPVDSVHRWILSAHKKRSKDDKAKKKLKIADFGCGDAMLAQKLLQIKEEGSGQSKKERKQNAQSACPFHVNSFDLVANGNPHITPCDMANVPLTNGSVDIAVFVLALMGTNIADFIREAHRVLTPDGKLKIAEVRSRFESASADDRGDGKFGGKKSKGNQSFKYSKKKADDSLLNEFIEVMQKLGFKCNQNDRSNKMFFLLEFEKTGKRPSKEATFTAKPCIYKRR